MADGETKGTIALVIGAPTIRHRQAAFWQLDPGSETSLPHLRLEGFPRTYERLPDLMFGALSDGQINSVCPASADGPINPDYNRSLPSDLSPRPVCQNRD
jgi:hypothetical protein